MATRLRRRLSLAAGSALDASAVDLALAAAAAGFAGVGLRLSAEHAVHGRDRARLRRVLDGTGLTLTDVEVYRIGTDQPIAPLVEAASELGASRLLVVSDLPDPLATEEALTEVVSTCGTAGLRVGLEYMAWTTPSTPLAALEVATRCGCEVVVDVLHHHRVGAGVGELRAIVAAHRLAWLQVCDAQRDPPDDLLHEARHHRLVPGEGALPLADLLAAVPEETWLSVEVQSDELRARLPVGERAAHLFAAAHRGNTTGYRAK